MCHIPFTMRQRPPFDIEQDIYAHWSELLNKMGVEYLLSGHMHALHVLRPGDEHLWNDAQFITLVGSETPKEYVGAHYTLSGGKLHVQFIHHSGEVRMDQFES